MNDIEMFDRSEEYIDSLSEEEHADFRNEALLIQGLLDFGKNDCFVMVGDLVELRVELTTDEIILIGSVDRIKEETFTIPHDFNPEDDIPFELVADAIRIAAKEQKHKFECRYHVPPEIVDYEEDSFSTIIEFVNQLSGKTYKSAFGCDYSMVYSYKTGERPSVDAVNDIIIDGDHANFTVATLERLRAGSYYAKGIIDYGYPVKAGLLLSEDFSEKIDFGAAFNRAARIPESLQKSFDEPFLGDTNGF